MAPPKRSVLITGCSDGGIGAALALEMHRSGNWRVLASARSIKKMQPLIDAGIETLSLDVLSEESLQTAATHISDLLGGKLDGLMLNAGGGLSSPIADLSIPNLRDVFELNVYSPIRTIQVFLPLLIASTNHPIIINHTSSAALTPVASTPWTSGYQASKAAYSSMVESLKHELLPFDITVVELRTGSVTTNFFNNLAAQEATRPRLPEGSIYEPARDEIEKVMRGKVMDETGIPSDVYAKRVVKDLDAGVQTIYRGKMASLAKWSFGLQALVPRWFINYMLRDMADVYAADKKIRAARTARTAEGKL